MKDAAQSRNIRITVLDSFEDAEAEERQEWMALSRQERVALLESLRAQTYPNERDAPQGLQRILPVVD
jgi:hypothetical protein